jgi:hypothetical protein
MGTLSLTLFFSRRNINMEINDETLAPLRALKAACGPKPNKHELATVLIIACIEKGLNTKSQLFAALTRLELSRGHIAHMLEHGTGNNPQAHWWRRDAEGRYHVHEQELTRN